jgi:hypothetical protein
MFWILSTLWIVLIFLIWLFIAAARKLENLQEIWDSTHFDNLEPGTIIDTDKLQ